MTPPDLIPSRFSVKASSSLTTPRLVGGSHAVGVHVVGGATVQFELTRFASEFTATWIRRFEVLWIVEVLVVDADDTRVTRIHREGYAGHGFACPG